MNTILVFDVETTGLLPKNPHDPYPSVLQLSYLLYDIPTKTIIEEKNAFIRVPESTVITPFVTELTGITREKVDTEGIDIREALADFYEIYKKADALVAHNMNFDLTVLQAESKKYYTELGEAIRQDKKPMYCTMQESIDICKLERFNKYGPYYKFPKLAELYGLYFCVVPENLHDARVDVLCCLRCFLYMKFEYTIHTDDFAKLILSINNN